MRPAVVSETGDWELKLEDIKIGDHVWIIETDTDDIGIYRVDRTVNETKDLFQLLSVNNGHTFIQMRSPEEMYQTESEARGALIKQIRKIRKQYLDSIQSVEDLIAFLLTHDIYKDGEARNAAEIRAEEYGIRW